MADNAITFLLNNEQRRIDQYDPSMTVLEYLRNTERKTGTKEGCASGDCGACTVVLRDAEGHYQSINACISLLPVLHGKQLITVEDLQVNGQLHGVQRAMVDHHASQCGFCTPGFVMSSFALHKNESNPDRDRVLHALSGNLCRCTGYRSIIDAALESPGEDQFDRNQAETTKTLQSIPQNSITIQGEMGHCFLPATVEELADLLQKKPDIRLLAGGTDLGLEVTQALRPPKAVAYLGHIPELKTIHEFEDHWDIGSATTFTQLLPLLKTAYQEMAAMVERLGSEQIRNQGTIGGNIGNASPIGDTPPVLIALGAELVLRQGTQQRTIPAETYFKDYKVTDLKPSEFIERIRLPKPKADKHLKVYKVSKRIDDDISAVLAAFHVKIENEYVVEFDAAFGGMAAIPKRAIHCEQALRNQPWTLTSIENAMQALEQDFTPLTDVRASKEYRLTVAQNLLKKCFLEITQATKHSRVTYYDAAQSMGATHA